MLTLSTNDDALYLMKNLRAADIDELAASGQSPATALLDGLYLSQPCFTAYDKAGNPALMMGVVPGEGMVGYVWLLGTDSIETEATRFLRASKPLLNELHKIRPALINMVHAENHVHIRWLRWLGFSFVAQRTFNNHQFYEIARLYHPCAPP